VFSCHISVFNQNIKVHEPSGNKADVGVRPRTVQAKTSSQLSIHSAFRKMPSL